MKASNPIKMVVITLAGLFLLAATQTTAAQEEGWQFEVAPYMWAAGIGGTTASGGDIDIGFSDIWDNLDMAFMGIFGARKGKWLLLTDVIYLDVEDDDQGTLTVPIGSGFAVGTDADVALKGWIVTPAVGYTVVKTEKARLDIVAGARYFWLKSDIEVKISGPLGTRGERFSDSGHVWDGIVGLKGEVTLAKKWYMPFYLDVGTGDSDLTWQALGGLAYKFKKLDVLVGYRYLEWDFDDNDVFDDMNISGPYAGLKIRF